MAKYDKAVSNNSTVQEVSSRTRELARSTADVVQEGLEKTQEALNATLDSVQGMLARRNRDKTVKQVRGSVDDARSNVKHTVNKGLTSAQHGLEIGQEYAQKGWETSQEYAQKAWEENAKRAAKQLKKAQHSLGDVQDVVQDAWEDNTKRAGKLAKQVGKQVGKNASELQDAVQDKAGLAAGAVATGLGIAQIALEKNAKKASKGLMKAQKNLSEVKDAWEDQIEHQARKRRRARTLFRLGLVAGVVAALLLAPKPGAETRRQVGGYLREFMGFFRQQPQSTNVMGKSYTPTSVPLNTPR